MKLRLILGLVIVVLALGLAACGGGDDEGDDGNGGDNGDGAAATKTAEAEKTDTPEVAETQEPEKTEEPSGGGGGGANLSDLPVYPGADKTGDWSGSDAPIPPIGGDVDLEDWDESAWATYETNDEWDTVADWYRGKMSDGGWKEEGWSDVSFGGGAAWGSFTKNDGDNAAWVFVSGYEDNTQIVIGAAHK